MFKNGQKFNYGIGAWNTSKVTNMQDMFNEATVFNQDISLWDVSKVTNTVNVSIERIMTCCLAALR
jgi:surface protein